MKNKHFLPVLLVAFIICSSQSCVKYKDLVSLNRIDKDTNVPLGKTISHTDIYPFKAHHLRPYDQLMIKINANVGDTKEFINKENTYNREIRFDPPSLYYNTYSLDDLGYVRLPEIDPIYAEGLTTMELKQKIDLAYKSLFKFASTTVKLANMKCTVIGEVNQPGVQFLYNEKTTLLEAIGLSGDFTEFARRDKVKVIRTLDDGNTKTVYLDLSTYHFARTEYYFVQPDDIIYIEPVNAKSFDASSKALGVVFSAISALALIANLIIK